MTHLTDPTTKTIAFLLYEGGTPLDLIGPLQVLGALGPRYRAVVVSDVTRPVAMDVPIRLQATAVLEDVPRPDVLVIPGGTAGTYRAMHDDRILQYVRDAAEHATTVMSVCTGSLILGAAGLLQGRDATTHWAAAKLLERYGARYVRRRWIEDDRFLMTAGVSAGIDGALHLAAKLTERTHAQTVQAWLEYDPQPPFGPFDWQLADVDRLPPDWFEQQAQQALRAQGPAKD
ncbi:DJ-1/PfpI family protein [Deinococcus pimensis]|uniref:DJ-1/PfpI family protein n=1 Tax=Deinococcus pimensis TaxID=309888 RepID=UPI0005EB744B|nr:DJ-1/PfpI family protein [Deinococcus pimensis]